MNSRDSSDRAPGEFTLFALAFLGFLIGAGGVVIASPWLALSGLAFILLAVVTLGGSAPDA